MSKTMIFVECLLEAQHHAAVIDKHRDSLRRMQVKRFSAAREQVISALWSGMWQLRKEAEACAVEARDRGQLLFCWAGTKAISTGSPA
jgi:hypothetical protein